MTDSRLAVRTTVHVDADTEINPWHVSNVPWVNLEGSGSSVAIILAGSPTDVIGSCDRLTAAIAEIRTAVVVELGQDPATAATSYDPANGSPDPVPDLADGNHFAGMPPTTVTLDSRDYDALHPGVGR